MEITDGVRQFMEGIIEETKRVSEIVTSQCKNDSEFHTNRMLRRSIVCKSLSNMFNALECCSLYLCYIHQKIFKVSR